MDPVGDEALLRLDLASGDGEAVLSLVGELDLSTASVVEAEIGRLSSLLSRSVVLDLRGLTFLDCAGVRPLVHLSEELGAHQCQLVVAGPTRAVAYVLAAAGLMDGPAR